MAGAVLGGTLAARPVFSPVMAGLGVGIALAGAPGPVQAVLLAESARGGINRGFRALAGANLTFGSLLVCLAFGLSLVAPRGPALGALQVAGGAFLLWVSAEGLRSGQGRGAGQDLRSGHGGDRGAARPFALPPAALGALAVVLNPGAWLFLAAVASPLFASADLHGGTGGALAVAVVVMAGVAAGDGAVVLLGGIGVRRAGGRARNWVRWALAAVLAGFGGWLLVTGVISLVGT
jgi:threonine/homoserine/homoserine lactone efflux protein